MSHLIPHRGGYAVYAVPGASEPDGYLMPFQGAYQVTTDAGESLGSRKTVEEAQARIDRWIAYEDQRDADRYARIMAHLDV